MDQDFWVTDEEYAAFDALMDGIESKIDACEALADKMAALLAASCALPEALAA